MTLYAPIVLPQPAAPRVALVHYWLLGMRGGERVLEALCRMFPQAHIFTHVADPSRLSPTLTAHKITQTRIARLPFARRMYQSYLPLMPAALEALDLTGYDLVISSESGPAKGVMTRPDAVHLCYCHSPMRYVWDHYHQYRRSAGPLTRAVMPPLARYMRNWDVASAGRVDRVVANSRHVAARIRKYWQRSSDLVFPPVTTVGMSPVAPADVQDYYLWVGELAPYKRPDLAVEAFRQLDKPLVIIGNGPGSIRRLQSQAGPKTRFLGPRPRAEVQKYMAHCKALVFPGEEDFGIVPVEVMAAGRPVLGLGRGGLCDTVLPGRTGLLYDDQTAQALAETVLSFEASALSEICQTDCVTRAEQFSEDRFVAGIRASLRRIQADLSLIERALCAQIC